MMHIKPIEDQDEEEMHFISSVTLGGFQVFDKPTTIPLGRLTFLFGPNSAGKSAIEDALVLLLDALNIKRIDRFNTGELERHWRRVGNQYVPTLTIGITAGIDVNLRLQMAVPNRDIGSLYKAFGHEIGITFRYYCDEGNRKATRAAHFDLRLDGIPLIELYEEHFIGVNFAHPMLEGFTLVGEYDRLAAQAPRCISSKDGWVRIHSRAVFLQKETDLEKLLFGLELEVTHAGLPSENWRYSEPMRVAANEVISFFDTIIHAALRDMPIVPNIVSASRAVPNPKDLTFLFAKSDSLLKLPGMFAHGDHQYLHLADSCLAKRLCRDDGGTDDYPLLDSVNRALRSHLFVERGYRVSAAFRVILEFENQESFIVPDAAVIAEQPLLVHIHLTDSQGSKQEFDQVGSGLGYVLPVLCSVADPAVQLSILQQPELHLHPALQACLGDIFIESAGKEQQIIVETHSEHLLLRILKRIRQTSQGTLAVPELALRPDDVVVAYFDPNTDGTTSVKRLRISEDGEFVDRWPRGFFTERDGELFDE